MKDKKNFLDKSDLFILLENSIDSSGHVQYLCDIPEPINTSNLSKSFSSSLKAFEMKLSVLTLIIIFKILNLTSAVDYCNLCKNHVACKNNGKFAASCPKDASIVKLSNNNVETILKAHNFDRNLLASGKVPGYKSATKMMILVCFLDELKIQGFIRHHLLILLQLHFIK